MNLEAFSPVRGAVTLELRSRGVLHTLPGTPEHRACTELVAFGRARQVALNVFAPERRIGKR